MANQPAKIDSRIGELALPIKRILEEMFTDYQEIILLSEINTDLSNSRMLILRPVTASGAELYALVKIDTVAAISREWQAYEAYLRNKLSIANIQEEPVYLPGNQYGGLCYIITKSSVLEVMSLAEYCQKASLEETEKTVASLLHTMEELWEQHEKVQANPNLLVIYDSFLPANLIVEVASVPSNIKPKWLHPTEVRHHNLQTGDLVELGDFKIIEIERTKNRILLDTPESSNAFHLYLEVTSDDINHYEVGGVIEKTIMGVVKATRQEFLENRSKEFLSQEIDLTMESISVGDNLSLPNPLLHYLEAPIQSSDTRKSYIHGNLHLNNILVERNTGFTHLINFDKSGENHVLRDLLCLEMAVVMDILPQSLNSTKHLPKAILDLYTQVHCSLLQQNVTVSNDNLVLNILKRIRQAARHRLFKANDWSEYYNGLGLCLLGALKFNHLDLVTCQTAFWGSSVAFHLAQTDIHCPDPPKLEIPLAHSSDIPQTLNFVDRKKEVKILNEYKQSCQVIVIQGPPGIGKSDLSNHWAKQLLDKHIPIIRINCQKFITIDIDYIISILAEISPDLDVSWRLPNPNSIGLRPDYKENQNLRKTAEVLRALDENGYMLILDGFETVIGDESLSMLIQASQKGLQKGRILLVTQERPKYLDNLHRVGQLDLGELPLDDAKDHLISLLKNDYTNVLDDKMESIGGFPMYLDLMATRINYRNPTYKELVSEIPKYRREISKWFFQDLYESLNQTERELLCHLAVFSEPITRSAAMTLLDLQTQEIGSEAFDILQDRSLIKPVNTKIGEFVMHSLVREFAFTQMGDDLYRSANRKAAHLYLSTNKSQLNPSETSTEIDNKLIAFNHFLEAHETDLAIQIVEEIRTWLIDHGRYEQAIKILNQALQLLDEQGLQTADFCWNLGQIYEYQAKYPESLKWLERGRRALGDQKDSEVAARLALWHGIVYIRLRNVNKATTETREAIRISERVGAKPEAARAHNLKGVLEQISGNLSGSYSECTTSAKIYESLQDEYGIAAAYSNIGVVTFELGDWKTAEEAYRNALQAQSNNEDLYGEMITSTNLADLLAHLGEFDESVKSVKRTFDLAKQLDSALGEAHAYATSGLIHLQQGQYDQALVDYHKSAEVLEEYKIGEIRDSVHIGRTGVYLAIGELSQAEAEAQQISDNYRATKLRLLGEIYQAGRNFIEAEQVLRQSLETLDIDGQPYERALTLRALAHLYFNMNDDKKHSEGVQMLEKAITIFESLEALPDLQLAKGFQK